MANEMVMAYSDGASAMAVRSGTGWVQMKGDSMCPTIEPGAWVEVDPSVTAFAGPGIYLTAFSRFTPSRLCPRPVPQLRRLGYVDGELHSISDNSHYPPFKVDIDDLLIGGKALGVA